MSSAPLSEPATSWRRPVRKILRNWRQRHRHPFNFWIHLVGIPVAVAGVVFLIMQEWYWGVGALAVGYFLQFLGHRVEGNDVGEWAAIKRLCGRPYVSIAPQWQATSTAADSHQP